MTGADVVVIGAGIAGLSAAWHANRAGRAVTIVDGADHRASDVPVALINPLRGHTGRLVADGVDGMQATFALIDALRGAGHRVDSGRGLYRPLIDVAPDALVEAFWRSRLDGRLAFDWLDVAPAALGLAAPVPCLFLRDAGWVGSESLLEALAVGSGARQVRGHVTRVVRADDRADVRGNGRDGAQGDAHAGGQQARYVVSLADGDDLVADSVLWCAGARGASLLDRAVPSPAADGIYKPGSLVAVDGRVTAEPLAFGLYAVPVGATTLIGPTREGSSSDFGDGPAPPDAVGHLGDRIARVFGTTLVPRDAWRGVRLGRLSSNAASALAGIPTLTALGSRGFLMAPLLAARWARSL